MWLADRHDCTVVQSMSLQLLIHSWCAVSLQVYIWPWSHQKKIYSKRRWGDRSGFQHDVPLTHFPDWKRKQRGIHMTTHTADMCLSIMLNQSFCILLPWHNLDILLVIKSTLPVCFDVLHIIFGIMAATTCLIEEMLHSSRFSSGLLDGKSMTIAHEWSWGKAESKEISFSIWRSSTSGEHRDRNHERQHQGW